MTVAYEFNITMKDVVVNNTTELLALLASIHDGHTANVQPFFDSGAVKASWILNSNGTQFIQTNEYESEEVKDAFDAARREAGYIDRFNALGWTATVRRL